MFYSDILNKKVFIKMTTLSDIQNPQKITAATLLEKYCRDAEVSEDEIFKRVAKDIAANEKNPSLRKKWEKIYYENMKKGAVGAGRIMASAGTGIKATLINCFVQPVADSILDTDSKGRPGIYLALAKAAETMRRGGGVGYDFSNIRPSASLVKGTASYASGPCSYIDVFDASCRTVESAGARRGAQLAALKISHPDIQDYIVAKRTPGRWNNFNVSIFIIEGFMEAVKNDNDWELFHEAEPSEYLKKNGAYKRQDGKWVYKTVKAKELWETIMKSNYDFAEPGILFGDNINRDNNLRYVEVIDATNPCGEQPLPPYGCCDLGPIILPRFIRNPFSNKEPYFDVEAFREAVKIQVRFLDSVLDRTFWPLEEQRKESDSKRRIGVGFTGLGNALAMLNIRYDSQEGCTKAAEIACIMRDAAYSASVELAKEKGKFPLFDADKYLEEGTFASRLPESIKQDIRKYGIRNSHLLSIAPVGTISLAFADNASNGIEPPFSLAYERKKRKELGGFEYFTVVDHAARLFLASLEDQDFAKEILTALCSGAVEFTYKNKSYNTRNQFPSSFVTAMEMSASAHLKMMGAVQPFIDSAISKTINVPADYDFESFKLIYEEAHRLGLKGTATYRPNPILGSVLSVITQDKPKEELKDPSTVFNDFMNESFEKRPEGRLEGVSEAFTYFNSEGEVKFYVGVSYIVKKIEFTNSLGEVSSIYARRPIELFINSEMNVGNEWSKLLGITLSQMARIGIKNLSKYLKTCLKMRSDRGSIRFGFIHKPDGGKAPRYHGSDIAVMAHAIQDLLRSEGIFNNHGDPVNFDDINVHAEEITGSTDQGELNTENNEQIVATGTTCEECGAPSVIKKDGCKFCTNCGWQGSCG